MKAGTLGFMISRVKKNLTYTLEQRYGGLHEKKQRNIILYIGTSIDGYIANANGALA